MSFPIDDYLTDLKSKLLRADNWQKIELVRRWTNPVPNAAGVYVLKDGDNLIYVGETGNLKGRMNDLIDSRQHSIRRTLGEKLYNSQEGFRKATASIKFPEQFETLLNVYIITNLSVAYLEVPLGRKELEEEIDRELDVSFRLNKRGKRGMK